MMIKVPNVNLMPWRDELKKRRNSQFITTAGVTSIAAIAVVGFGWLFMDMNLTSWNEDNDYLKTEIVSLDKQIVEIKELKNQTAALLARKQVIENLQTERVQTVNVFRQLSAVVPDGVVLKGVKNEGQKITLAGFSQSNAKVSALMKALEADDVFELPVLIESKSAMVAGRKVYDFSMTVMVTKLKTEVTKEQSKKGAK